MKPIHVGSRIFDNKKLFVMAGPCVIEEPERTLNIGREMKRICEDLGLPYIFKASFDKANRSSYRSYRGPGLMEGLRILQHIKEELQVPVVSDIHEVSQAEKLRKCWMCCKYRPSSAGRRTSSKRQRRQGSV